MSDFTQRFLDAMNSHDAARLAACYAEDATHEDLALGVFYEGRNAIKASIEEAEKYSNEYQFTSVSQQTNGDRYAIEWEVAGTTTGEAGGLLATDTGEMVGGAAAGTPYRVRGVSVGRIDADGNIKENRDYYNIADYLAQIGTLPRQGTGTS